jgi:hypothetical protein
LALVPIQLKPGIDVQSTPLLNSGGWSESANVRFFQDLAQKDGGFVEFTKALAGLGTPNALRAWTALSQISFLAISGTLRLNIFAADSVYDVTPLSITSLVPISLAVTAGSPTVVIRDLINPTPTVGENIEIHDPVSIANLVLQGSYIIQASSAGQYSISASVNANATTTGGVCRQFTTIIGQAVVAVHFPNHGLFNGQTTSIPDPTPVGGIILQGNYAASVAGPNDYTITAASRATFSATVTENAGAIQITFTNPASGGVQGDFRNSSATTANWGEFLFWNPKDGPVYVWQPALGLTGNAATDVATAPQANRFIFVATQQQQLFCCGTVNRATGLLDPMLVAWSDVSDYTVFTPLTTNQAGSFRLVIGSTVVGGLALAGGNLIWTDLALYSAQYLQPPDVWGFQPIGINCGLIGPHAFGTLGQFVAWMSQNQFYQLVGGAPQVMPCTVWDTVFKNIDLTKTESIVCESNTYFNEISWEVPQKDGTVTRARVDITNGRWVYTILPTGAFLPRTAWIDQSVFGPPLAGDATGVIWQHEVGTDAGTQPLLWMARSGQILISEGDQVTFFREFLFDAKFTESGAPGPGVVELLVYVYHDSLEPPAVKGPFPITSTTRSIPIRGRGRAIQFEFRGRDLNSWIRLGNPRYRGQIDGRS